MLGRQHHPKNVFKIDSLWSKFPANCACVCIYVYVFKYVHVGVYAFIKYARACWDHKAAPVSSQLTPNFFLAQSLLLNLKQIDLVRLASQQAQGILPFLSPKPWDYRHVPPFLASLILAIELRSSYLGSKHSINWAIPPAISPPQHTFDSFLPHNPEICSFGKCLMPDLGSL